MLQTILNGETAAPPEIVNFLDHRLVATSGVWATATNNLQVNQETSPAMSVKVHQGYASILNSTGSTHYPVALTVADASVAIGANSSGFTRIDSLVLYINTGASANSDATNVATLVAVQGTPSGSPTAPSAGTIQAAVGASNPYIILANVTIASGASSIVDANISDQRALVTFNSILQSSSTWIAGASTWTFASADGPTGVITTGSDESANITLGDRIKLTQTTVKYFIVTAISGTTLTVYGGTDYTLANAAITLPFYSHAKSPSGFPTSPIKWTEVTTSTANDSQASPVAGTWYNVGSRSLSIPIGVWFVDYQAAITSQVAGTSLDLYSTLSTANNTESDKEFSTYQQIAGASGTITPAMTCVRMKQLSLAAKTSYFLNCKTLTASTTAIQFRGDIVTTKIRALCAYL